MARVNDVLTVTERNADRVRVSRWQTPSGGGASVVIDTSGISVSMSKYATNEMRGTYSGILPKGIYVLVPESLYLSDANYVSFYIDGTAIVCSNGSSVTAHGHLMAVKANNMTGHVQGTCGTIDSVNASVSGGNTLFQIFKYTNGVEIGNLSSVSGNLVLYKILSF